MQQPYGPLVNSCHHLLMNESYFVKIIHSAYNAIDIDGKGKIDKSKLVTLIIEMAHTLNLKATDHDLITHIDELFPKLLTQQLFTEGVLTLLHKLIKSNE